jgi:hypothetical protein
MGKRKVFGDASDFYRVRIMKLEETEMPDFDWHENILIKKPEIEIPDSKVKFCVQIVSLDERKVFSISSFKSETKAKLAKRKIEEDIEELTKNQFEKKYNLAE